MAEHIIMQNLPEKMKEFYGDEVSRILASAEDEDFLERLRFADEYPLVSEPERERIGEILQGENFKGVKSPVTQSVEDLFPKGKE